MVALLGILLAGLVTNCQADVLYAAGDFAGGVAQWNGAKWLSIGSGPGGGDSALVYVLAQYKEHVVAAGSFDTMDGVAAKNIAQ